MGVHFILELVLTTLSSWLELCLQRNVARVCNVTENPFFLPYAISQVQPHIWSTSGFPCQDFQMAPFQGMLFTGNVMWVVPLTPIMMAHTGTFTMTECLLIPRSTDTCVAQLSMPLPPDTFLPPSLPLTVGPGWDRAYQITASDYLDTCLL